MFTANLRSLWSFLSLRRLHARILSTLICAVLIVIRPFSKYGGNSAYLALTVSELVFSVQANLAQQIEATVLHLTGGLAAIGFSTLGKYLASLPPSDAPSARLIPALFLVLISFLAGWAKSSLPRLTLASRIACFLSIWLLTLDAGEEQHLGVHAQDFVWITLVAALTSLVSSLLLLRWSSTQFACDIATIFSKLHTCLEHNLEGAQSQPQKHSSTDSIQDIHRELLRMSVSLNVTYQQAAFELRIGRVGVKSLKPLIGLVEHLRREFSRTTSFPRPSTTSDDNERKVIDAFHIPALELGSAVLASMKVVETIISACFNKGPSRPLRVEHTSLITAQALLAEATSTARSQLRGICDELDTQQRASDGIVGFPDKVFDLCSCMISLLQSSREMQQALRVAEDILITYDESPLRLWHPRLSLAWLGVAPSTVLVDEDGIFLEEETPELQDSLSVQETMQGIAERTYDSSDHQDYEKSVIKKPKLVGKPTSFRWWRSLIYLFWNHPRTMKSRLALAAMLKSVKHSPHLRHAAKNAIGVAVLSIPAFLPANSPGHEWFFSSYGQWTIISYIWVLETNTGATWRVGYLRLLGTVGGAIYAYIASVISHSDPYALVALVTIAELPISWVIMKTTFPSLGTVASITLPPILFTHYFRVDDTPSWRIALLRTSLICAGILAALLMNSILFPRHCRVMFLNSTCRTLGLTSQLYMTLSRDLFHHNQMPLIMFKRKIYTLERDTRKYLHRMSILLKTMDDEFSLVPKPMNLYRQIHTVLHHLSDLLTRLRKAREHIPRKETVTAVTSQRREMVSCICVSLFASEQVFRARQPLPQFLPSCRVALDSLEKHVEERIRLSRQEEAESLGLPMIYAFAEMNIMMELVETIDELLHLTRQLFGTSSWLNLSPTETMLMTSTHEEVGCSVV